MQLDRPTVWDTDRVWRGVQRSACGLLLKAGRGGTAPPSLWDTVFANPAVFDRTPAAAGRRAVHPCSSYADFSGYTDIVLGVGEVLACTCRKTSASRSLPTRSRTSGRGGHISLSQWLRDYIYIPLGGSRCSKARKDGNLIITSSSAACGTARADLTRLGRPARPVERRKSPAAPAARVSSVSAARGGHILHSGGCVRDFPRQQPANAAELFEGILCNGGHAVFSNYWELGLTSLQEEILLYAGIAILLAVDAAHERGISLRTKIAALPTPARWAVYEVCSFCFPVHGPLPRRRQLPVCDTDNFAPPVGAGHTLARRWRPYRAAWGRPRAAPAA